MFRAIHVTKVTRQLLSNTFGGTNVIIPLHQQNKNFCCDQSKDRAREPLDFSELKFASKVPLKPHASPINLVKIDRIEIDEETLQLLERLSLVNVDSK